MDWTVIVGWFIAAGGVGAIVSTAVNNKIKKLQTQQAEQQRRQAAIEMGLQALLRDKIICVYNKYTEKGAIPIYERENVEHMYTEYKALGGNGILETLIVKLRDLPTP